MIPGSGDVLLIDREASVQFLEPILLRVIRVHNWTTYTGWVWLDGYQLLPNGDAIERRSVFVQLAGLKQIPTAIPPAARRNAARSAKRKAPDRDKCHPTLVHLPDPTRPPDPEPRSRPEPHARAGGLQRS